MTPKPDPGVLNSETEPDDSRFAQVIGRGMCVADGELCDAAATYGSRRESGFLSIVCAMSVGSIRRPDFAELETFLAAARTGSLAQAGEELRVSKTAVAKRISALEALVDCRLLERGSRGVALTDAGRQFVPLVEQMLAEADRALEAIDGRRGRRDRLRIAGARSLTGARAGSTERVLAETEHLFAEVFHEVADGIVIASLEDQRILEVNDAYCRIVGYSREEVVGRTPAELGILPRIDLQGAHARATTDEGGLAEREFAIRTKTGDQRTVGVSARPVDPRRGGARARRDSRRQRAGRAGACAEHPRGRAEGAGRARVAGAHARVPSGLDRSSGACREQRTRC